MGKENFNNDPVVREMCILHRAIHICTVSAKKTAWVGKKTHGFFKILHWLQFFTKADETLYNDHLLDLFKDNIFGSFLLSSKMLTNTVSLVKNVEF